MISATPATEGAELWFGTANRRGGLVPPLDSGFRRNDEGRPRNNIFVPMTRAGGARLGTSPSATFSLDYRLSLASRTRAGIYPGSESKTCFRTNNRRIPAATDGS